MIAILPASPSPDVLVSSVEPVTLTEPAFTLISPASPSLSSEEVVIEELLDTLKAPSLLKSIVMVPALPSVILAALLSLDVLVVMEESSVISTKPALTSIFPA